MIFKSNSQKVVREIKKEKNSINWPMIENCYDRAWTNKDIDFFNNVLSSLDESKENDPFIKDCLTGLALIDSKQSCDVFFEYILKSKMLKYNEEAYPRDMISLHFGAVLSYGQSPRHIDGMLSKYSEELIFVNLFSSWIQESVLRGEKVQDYDSIVNYWNNQNGEYLLFKLPLTLYEIESEQPKLGTSFSIRGKGAWSPGKLPNMEGINLNNFSKKYSFEEKSNEKILNNILQTVGFQQNEIEDHLEAEARFFVSDEQIVDFNGEFLKSLPLVSFAYEAESGKVNWSRIDTLEIKLSRINHITAFNILMERATNGGPYEPVWSGAKGRLRAWKGLAGMLGYENIDDLTAIQGKAESSSWLLFDVDNGYFDHVCSDLGLICIHPDKKTVTVLAYSDCD